MKKLLFICLISIGNLLNSQTNIPFELIENRIVVEVKINDNTYNFALDFQKDNLIAQDLLEENGHPSSSQDSVIANDVMINQLQIGKLKYLYQVFTAVDFSNFRTNNITVDGILNFSLFSNYVYEIDFINQQIHLREKGYLPTGNAFKVTLYSDEATPYVIANINNQDCNLALDFSINAPLILHSSFFENDINFNLDHTYTKMDNDLFKSIYAQPLMIDHFVLGEIDALQLQTLIIQNKMNYMDNSAIKGGIGTQMFSKKSLYLDFDKNSLWIK